jgi:hypothetical protein
MDDQDATQHPADPSTSQARARRQKPTQTRQEALSAPPSQPLSKKGAPENASQPLERPTRQLPPAGPQPILFADEEIVLLKSGRPPRLQRFRRTRRWLRSRAGRIVVPLLALLVGLAIGLTSILWYGLSGEGPVLVIPPSVRGNLIIEADKSFVTQLVRKDLASAGLPGQVKNVTVDLDHGAMIVIQGDDVYSVLGVAVSRHFTVDVQPYVHSCILQVRVTHADLGGIPVTTFVQSFQGNINQELAQKPAGLPNGFTYCTVGVRTEPVGMFITYEAIPVSQ